MHRSTHRRWRSTVGLVGPADVRELQRRVHDYRASIQASIDAAAAAGQPLPIDGSQWSIQAWGDLVGRADAFERESESGPLAYLYAGSAYERGRRLIEELDRWRDHMASLGAPRVPAPMPVPHSDVGLAGGLAFGLAALVAILALRELR